MDIPEKYCQIFFFFLLVPLAYAVPDSDIDGVPDIDDICQNTSQGEAVHPSHGCGCEYMISDDCDTGMCCTSNSTEPPACYVRAGGIPHCGIEPERISSGIPLLSSQYIEGQIIVDPNNPRWLVYNRDSDSNGELDPFFLAGVGDPEMFLYYGTRNADGTRNGNQMQIINRLIENGGNAIYLDAIRSHGKNTAANMHNPYIDGDPNKGFDNDILQQWKEWFTTMDEAGIVIYFFFYDGGSHPLNTCDSKTIDIAERGFIEKMVNEFKQYKHLIWVIREEFNGEPRIGCPNWDTEKIHNFAEVIREYDNYNHVIAVHQWPGNSHPGVDTETEFLLADDEYLDQFAMQLNYYSNVDEMRAKVLDAVTYANGRYQVNMAESTWDGSGPIFDFGDIVRKKAWATALSGAYYMQFGWFLPESYCPDRGNCNPSNADLNYLKWLQEFMENTDFNKMVPDDQHKWIGSKYMLSNRNTHSYIIYCNGQAPGIKNIPAATYSIDWINTKTGEEAYSEYVNPSQWSSNTFPIPSQFKDSNDLVVWVRIKEDTSCTPGEVSSTSCGKCGTKTRTCQADSSWSGFSECMDESGDCLVGETQTAACPLGGEKLRTCLSSCTWGEWGTCSDNPSQSVTGFSVVNSDTDQTISGLSNGDTIEYSVIGTRNININANTNPQYVGSVMIYLDGNFLRTENSYPYSAAGDLFPDYLAFDPPLSSGSHTLKAIPYSGYDGTGTQGSQKTIEFNVCDNSADATNNLKVFNADTGKEIGTLNNGQTINYPKNNFLINIEVEADGAGSVKIIYSGNADWPTEWQISSRTEYEYPFTFPGDTQDGLKGFTPRTGMSHTIRAISWSGKNLSGTKISEKEISFYTAASPGQCYKCGEGLFNLCDESECHSLGEGCRFEKILWYGKCRSEAYIN
ncbi:hypothetical protein K9M79_05685 [Candidatus Woesearchaeota archaeon]|nr:hypothetical protein [Candidatus Woesearchaeota archaeon]